jgi:cytochrome P450
MLMYPEVQRKAQAEIDALFDGERLPTLADRPQLPYCDAVCKELKRWHTIGPLGVPHVTTAEEEYRGMRIPKGSIVQTNVRHIHHDDRNYVDPHSFVPERWLPEKAADMPYDPSQVAFGFGRRICPGRHLADKTTFSAMIHILSVYTIGPEPGKPVPTQLAYIDGTVSIPKKFECKLELRSPRAAELFGES